MDKGCGGDVILDKVVIWERFLIRDLKKGSNELWEDIENMGPNKTRINYV